MWITRSIRLWVFLYFGLFALLTAGCSDNPNPGASPPLPPPLLSPVLLPDTGQEIFYTETFGEDSDYSINPQSYTKLDARGADLPNTAESWTMVRDNVNGLIWEVKTTDGSIHDKDRKFTWREARFDFIKELNEQAFGGFTDWRLPYIRELSCLVHADRYSPAINTDFFPHTPKDFRSDFWSYDICERAVQMAWFVRFGWGEIYYENQSEQKYARAVRGKADFEQDDYLDNGDGTVIDQYTGLMWQQDTADEQMTWEEALAYCENLSLAGYDDWRLPNRNELQSLVDIQPDLNAWMSIDIKAFPNTYPDLYWTSTHHSRWTDGVWAVSFFTGNVTGTWPESSSFYVRAVRAGNRR